MKPTSIEGGRSIREKIVIPEFLGVPEQDETSREYIEALIYDVRRLFESTGVDETSISDETVNTYRDIIVDLITKMKGAPPSLYNYYEWLYDKLVEVVHRPDKVPDETFVAQVLAIMQLSGITDERS